jgi:acyl-coenzyme A synthetase/AMP-(fatty) acid ligase
VRDEALARAGREVVIDYGATETNCTATGDASLFDRHPGAIGYAVADARIEVVDGQGHPQPPGREGLVRTRTPYMVLGYGVDQECADEVFSDGWFYPGDLGVLFEDGLVAVTGRQTETLNISGMKAPLLDFEAPLARLSGIRDVCAIVLKLDDGDHLAFLVVCDDAVDLQSLPEKIARELPLPVPFKLLRVVSIPRNAMGKIPRNSLSEIYSKVYLREIARARQGR